MIAEITKEMIHYFGNDVKRINHALKVYSFAKTIAELEHLNQVTRTIIEVTAILHDIGIKEAERKYNSSAGNYQEKEGPTVAKSILEKTVLPFDTINRICFIIANHHSLSKIDDIDFQIIVEADFLVNIFEDEITAETVKAILEKHFKTKSGIQILSAIYVE
jgi:HD superfamily phosphodiesterase